MLTDYNTQLALTQAITVATLSTNVYDLGAAQRTLFQNPPLFAAFTMTTAAASATASASVEFQLVQVPNALAVNTAFTFTFNSTDDVDGTAETITEAAHGLIDGMRVTVAASSGALPTGLAASTNYFVKNATTNTFQLSLTPGGAAVGLTAAVGVTTVTYYPVVVANSGPIPIQRLGAGAVIRLTPQPIIYAAALPLPMPRYLAAYIVPSHTLTAGAVTIDLSTGLHSDRHFYPSGYDIA